MVYKHMEKFLVKSKVEGGRVLLIWHGITWNDME